MHLKRKNALKILPIPRKGTKYVVRANSDLNQGLAILIVLRNMLKYAENRREAKRIISEKKVLVNNKNVKDEKKAVLLLDTISIIPAKKYYRLELAERGKFILNEISEKESNEKIAKVVNKRILKNKKVQLNLSDGSNFISDIKCKMKDSVQVNFKNKKVEKCVPLKEGAKAIVFGGKYSGQKGTIEDIKEAEKMITIKTGKEKINVLIKQVMATE